MGETDTRWQERCERYFSSMVDVRHRQNSQPAKGATKKEDLYKVDEGARAKDNDPRRHKYVTTFSRKKQPAKGLIKWLGGLDLHGTSMLLRARSSLYIFFWIAISVLATCVFCVGAFLLIREYSQSSNIFRPEVSNNGTNASPLSVLLCNSNRIRKSKIEAGSRFQSLNNITLDYLKSTGNVRNINKLSIPDLLENTNLKSFLQDQSLEDTSSTILQDLNNEYNFYSEMNSSSDWYTLARSVLMTDMNLFLGALHMTSSELQDVGHGMENSIVRCSKNGRPCQPSEVSHIPTKELGSCAVVYLSLKDSWFETMTLTLDVQPEDYLDLVSPTPGVRVVVHSSASSSPPSLSESTVVTAGEGLRLSLSKSLETLRRSSECESETNYNRQECVSRCQQLHTAQVCGCSVSLESPLARRCQVNVQYEFVCQKFIQVLTAREQLPCQCPHPCRQESVTVSKSNFQWFTDRTEPSIRASLEQSIGSWNSSELRKSLVEIEIVWSSVPFVKLRQEKEIELWQLLLQLGALSAITVGISMVTGLELIWLCGKTVVVLCSTILKSPKKKDNQVQRVYIPPDFNPEFDTISWRAHPKETDKMDMGLTMPIGISDSPLNIRKVHSYPKPFSGSPEEADRGDTLFYKGRDSGFVYGFEERPQPAFQEEADAMFDTGFATEGDELYGQPWERTGAARTFTRVLVSREEIEGNNVVPFLNAPGATLREPHADAVGHEENDDDDLCLPLPLELLDQDRTRHDSEEMDITRQTYYEMDRSRHPSHDDSRARQVGRGIERTGKTSQELDRTNHTSEQHTKPSDQSPPLLRRPINKTMSSVLVDDKQAEKSNLYHNSDHRHRETVFSISGNKVREANMESQKQKVNRGPDLSRFHPTKDVFSPFQKSKHHQASSRHNSMAGKNNKGLNRTKERVTRPANETMPTFGNFFPRSKIATPYTWHNADKEGPGRAFAPSAYMTSGYDGRTAVYRPQASYFDAGGSAIRNESGETFYIHS